MWTYKNKKILSMADVPVGSIGFVYKITNLVDNRIYIGKKILFTSTRKKISKRKKAELKTRKVYEIVVKESNWLTYTGSSIDLNNDIEKLGKDKFKFEILEFACTKKYMTYCEVKYQFKHLVLENNSYNGNILGKLFNSDTENCHERT